MNSKFAEIVISALPAVSIIGHPFRDAFVGGITGAIISLVGIIGVHIDSKRMWRNEIFIKRMQTELVNFYDLLSEHIKNEYDTLNLSKLLNNKFDYKNKNGVEIFNFFETRLSKANAIEEQFIIIEPILKKAFKFKKNNLLNLYSFIETSQIIYKFFYDLISEINTSNDLTWEDFFEIIDDEIYGLQKQNLKELRNKFKFHCSAMKIKLKPKDEKLYGNELKNDNLYYNAYLAEIREKLYLFKTSISKYMLKEI